MKTLKKTLQYTHLATIWVKAFIQAIPVSSLCSLLHETYKSKCESFV